MGTLRAQFGRFFVGRFFCLFVIFCATSPSLLWAVKSGSIVICAETGKIHHEQNADAITHPASLTKMATLYLTFKALREGKLTFNQHLPVSKRATMVEPSKLWLKAGGTITVRDAILGLVTKSANDAAVVLAEALGNGSEDHFAVKMTHQAHQLGMSNTVFKNASGLPNKQQVTTARDMATLSRCLYKHFPEYFKFFKERKFVYKGQVHANHNHLLGRVPGVDGIKTGFIHSSGFNLAASMVRDNHRIIAVVLGGESIKARDNKMANLLEATHSYLTGKRGPLNKRNDCSIGDLICALSPSESRATPIKAKMHRAVLQRQCKPAKLVKAKYASVDHLLDDLNKDMVRQSAPTKRIQKTLVPLKKTKQKLKKSLKSPSQNRVKKSEGRQNSKKSKGKRL